MKYFACILEVRALGYLLIITLLVYPIVFSLSLKKPKHYLNTALVFFPPTILTILSILLSPLLPQDSFVQTYFGQVMWGFKLNSLNTLLSAMIYIIGFTALRYSSVNLGDDKKRYSFLKNVGVFLSLILTMYLSENLLVMYGAWVWASFVFNKLLRHFSGAKETEKSAVEKLKYDLLGDAFIVGFLFLLGRHAGSFSLTNILSLNGSWGLVEFGNQFFELRSIAIFSLVIGVAIKSVQYPFHSWLPNTLEAPTSSSALLHAGLINAGGFWLIKLSPLLIQSQDALLILALLGGVTAVFGVGHTLVQANIKRSLAYSTIAQMGFMMIQCGLGIFNFATVHLIAHSFYKAYSFLSSGSSVDIGYLNRYFPKINKKDPNFLLQVTLPLSMSLIFGMVYYFLGKQNVLSVGAIVLVLVLILALSQIILKHGLVRNAIKDCAKLISFYAGLSVLSKYLWANVVVNGAGTSSFLEFIVCSILMILFISLYLFQNNLSSVMKTNWGKKIYVRTMGDY